MMNIYGLIDRVVFSLPFGERYAAGLNDFTESMQGAGDHPEGLDTVFQIMDAIDSKSAALLTHISLIFTALSITYSTINEPSLFSHLILAEIIIYLLITIPCLRCVRIMRFRHKGKIIDMGSQIDELYKRVLLYRFSNMSALLATLSLVFLFLGKSVLS